MRSFAPVFSAVVLSCFSDFHRKFQKTHFRGRVHFVKNTVVFIDSIDFHRNFSKSGINDRVAGDERQRSSFKSPIETRLMKPGTLEPLVTINFIAMKSLPESRNHSTACFEKEKAEI